MAKPEDNPYKLFWMLGIAMMIPFVLLSGPLLGYLFWHFVGVQRLGLPSSWMFLFVALGIILSGIQVTRLIKRIQESDTKQKK
jgi:hypothetical protein